LTDDLRETKKGDRLGTGLNFADKEVQIFFKLFKLREEKEGPASPKTDGRMNATQQRGHLGKRGKVPLSKRTKGKDQQTLSGPGCANSNFVAAGGNRITMESSSRGRVNHSNIHAKK